MAKYRITAPDGGTYEITAPDDATEDQVMEFARSQIGGGQPQQPQRERTGAVPALLEGVGQGLTFGFSDEIEGAVRGGIDALTSDRSFGEAYDERLASARERQARAREDHPFAFYGGEIGSAIAVPFGAARVGASAARALPGAVTGPVASTGRALGFGQMSASAGRGLGARTVAGAREGAAYGALYGLGTGEGVEGRAENAMLGGALGAGVGTVAPAAVDLGSAAVRGVTNAVRGFTSPAQLGREKYVEALLRDRMPTGMAPDETGAVLSQHQNRLLQSQDVKPGVMSMDLGGENVRNLVRAAANQQSTGAQRLNNRLNVRQGNQWSRIEQDLADTLADGRAFHETTEQLAATRAQNAAPAFERAYSAPWNVKADDDLAKFLTERGYMRRMLEKTQESIEGMTGQSPDATRPWELLHRVKMEIDREIGRLKRGQQDSKANWTLRDLVQLKNEFKSHIDKHNKAFGAALKQYGDESALINAAEDGFDEALKAAPEAIRKTIGGMGRQEQEMYRLGFARALVDRVRKGNVTRDRTESIFSSPDMQKRLAAVFPDRSALREFQKRLVLEAKMADSRKAVQGNSTTAKQLTQAEEAGQPLRASIAIGQAATGRLAPVIDFLSRNAQRFSGMTPEVANSVIRAAMSRGAFDNIAAWERAVARAEREPAFRAELVQRLLAGFGAGITEPPGPTRVTIGRPDHWPPPRTAP